MRRGNRKEAVRRRDWRRWRRLCRPPAAFDRPLHLVHAEQKLASIMARAKDAEQLVAKLEHEATDERLLRGEAEGTEPAL